MKQRLIRWIVRNYLNAVLAEDVIQFIAGKRVIGGKAVTPQIAANIKGDASRIQNSLVHKEITKILTLVAYEKMFYAKPDEYTQVFGRALLFWINEYEKILQDVQQQQILSEDVLQ